MRIFDRILCAFSVSQFNLVFVTANGCDGLINIIIITRYVRILRYTFYTCFAMHEWKSFLRNFCANFSLLGRCDRLVFIIKIHGSFVMIRLYKHYLNVNSEKNISDFLSMKKIIKSFSDIYTWNYLSLNFSIESILR